MRFRIQSLQNENKQPPLLNLEIKWILNHVAMHTVAVPQLLLGLRYPRTEHAFLTHPDHGLLPVSSACPPSSLGFPCLLPSPVKP